MTGDWLTCDWMTSDWLTGNWLTGDWLTGDWLLVDLVPGQILNPPGCHLDGYCPEQYSYKGRCSPHEILCQTNLTGSSFYSFYFSSDFLVTGDW